jgi:glycerophosphoryl diester phosphodiesterase
MLFQVQRRSQTWGMLSTVLLFLMACNDRSHISSATLQTIGGLGHGGMGISSSYPLNSAEGIKKCLELGLDGTELDVQMTSDSVLVAFHDVDLADVTKLEGRIHEKTWKELKSTAYQGSLRGDCFLVSLDDLFGCIANVNQFYYTFDCKLHPSGLSNEVYQSQFIAALKRILEKYQLGERIAIESQDVGFLTACKREIAQSMYYYYPSSFSDGYQTAVSEDFDGITIASANITKDEVAQAHQAGLKVALWNVKTGSDNWNAIEKQPDFIQSDDPRHLKNALK